MVRYHTLSLFQSQFLERSTANILYIVQFVWVYIYSIFKWVDGKRSLIIGYWILYWITFYLSHTLILRQICLQHMEDIILIQLSTVSVRHASGWFTCSLKFAGCKLRCKMEKSCLSKIYHMPRIPSQIYFNWWKISKTMWLHLGKVKYHGKGGYVTTLQLSWGRSVHLSGCSIARRPLVAGLQQGRGQQRRQGQGPRIRAQPPRGWPPAGAGAAT